jgi:hypothetical protein
MNGGSGIVIIRYRLIPVIINSDYKYLAFTHSGSSQSQYTVKFPEKTQCDILVVGGGGGGGKFGGGGGAGGVLFGANKELEGTVNIVVGNGGMGARNIHDSGTPGSNGGKSAIMIKGTEYKADGGGGGGSRASGWKGTRGVSGASGGGGSHSNYKGYPTDGGASTLSSFTYTGWDSYGNAGGMGRIEVSGGDPNHASGGGGGAGSRGRDYDNNLGGGDGGTGKDFSGYFGTAVGDKGWFAGGGGGNTYWGRGRRGHGNGGLGLLGGGGHGGFDKHDPENIGENAMTSTGGGGGGSKWDHGTHGDQDGGNGGSGVVIIRFRRNLTKFLNTIQTDYSFVASEENTNYTPYTNFTLTAALSSKIQVNKLTAFVFLETGFYRFMYDLQGYNLTRGVLKIIIYNNDANGLPRTKMILENDYKTTFVSTGGFYKIAFCYNLYNSSNAAIDYTFNLRAKYSFTAVSSESAWTNMTETSLNNYLYIDRMLYEDLLLRNSTNNNINVNKLFKRDANFKGYTTVTNPGHDVLTSVKREFLDTPTEDFFKKYAHSKDMVLYDKESKDIDKKYVYEEDNEIKYIRAVKNELSNIDYKTLFGVQQVAEIQTVPPPLATSFFVSLSGDLPAEYITYGGIENINNRTPANVKDATFDVVSNSTKTIYIEASSLTG